MKKLTLIFAAMAIVATGFAQKNKVVSAYNYERSYQRSKKCSELKKGLDAIEAAKQHDETSKWAKTWRYRAKIMWAIHTSDKCKTMAPNALNEAYESYQKAFVKNIKNPEYQNLDFENLDEETQKKFVSDMMSGNIKFEDDMITAEFMQMMPQIGNAMINEGVTEYQNKNYDKAVDYFEKGIGAESFSGQLDTVAIYYLAIAYEKAEKDSNAIETYEMLTKLGYEGKDGEGPKIYYYLEQLYKKQGNKEKMLEVLEKGREKYPDDKVLLTEQIDYYLQAGKDDDALQMLSLAIEKDPNNGILYFARGTIFDKKGKLEKAEADYKKAIEINPETFDAYYNLGAMYFNKGADLINQANDLPLEESKKYDELMKQATEEFKKAVPYLEKANELKPEDIDTANTLIKLYTRTGDLEKAKALKAKYQ